MGPVIEPAVGVTLGLTVGEIVCVGLIELVGEATMAVVGEKLAVNVSLNDTVLELVDNPEVVGEVLDVGLVVGDIVCIGLIELVGEAPREVVGDELAVGELLSDALIVGLVEGEFEDVILPVTDGVTVAVHVGAKKSPVDKHPAHGHVIGSPEPVGQ